LSKRKIIDESLVYRKFDLQPYGFGIFKLVKTRCDIRNLRLEEAKNIEINFCPKIAQAFANSTSFSGNNLFYHYQKGISGVNSSFII
jgi:hypothetical protein